MNDYIDIYCERLGPGLWAEPVNALTNAAFFVAAFFVWRLARNVGAEDRKAEILAFLLLLIGTGSALFHTFATKWAQLSDVLPILFYQIAFIWFYGLDVMRWNPLRVAGLFGAFLACTVAAEQIPAHILNGSLSYAPAIAFLGGFGAWHAFRISSERYTIVLAAFLFLCSLAFRSGDMAVCAALPLGTHFFWHILNGAVLYLTARAYILAKAGTQR